MPENQMKLNQTLEHLDLTLLLSAKYTLTIISLQIRIMYQVITYDLIFVPDTFYTLLFTFHPFFLFLNSQEMTESLREKITKLPNGISHFIYSL